jgi:putative ABC transport system permease protein
MALGARQTSVLWMVLRDALALAGIGIAIGLPLSAASTRLLRGLLFEIEPTEISIFASIAAAIVAVTGVAGYIPAWRASRVDPMTALRHE